MAETQSHNTMEEGWLMAHGSWLMAHGSWLACPESSMPAIMLETILGKEISPMKTKKEKHETGVE
jgi:hypothetical protein